MNQGDFAPEGGSCIGKPTDWWFPLLKTGTREEVIESRKTTALAKAVCDSCPVRGACLGYSLRWEPWGIWGGYDEQQRAEMRWERRISLHREGRIVFSGIGLRDANGVGVFGRVPRV
jgi:WhiB family redox-sensing transcriptional regulator